MREKHWLNKYLPTGSSYGFAVPGFPSFRELGNWWKPPKLGIYWHFADQVHSLNFPWNTTPQAIRKVDATMTTGSTAVSQWSSATTVLTQGQYQTLPATVDLIPCPMLIDFVGGCCWSALMPNSNLAVNTNFNVETKPEFDRNERCIEWHEASGCSLSSVGNINISVDGSVT